MVVEMTPPFEDALLVIRPGRSPSAPKSAMDGPVFRGHLDGDIHSFNNTVDERYTSILI